MKQRATPDLRTPTVRARQFDGPRPVRVMEVYSTPGSSQIVNGYEDGTHGDYAIDGETAELLPLVTGRRTTGQVIKAGVDCVTYDEGRSIISPMPGVWVSLHADGVNALTPALRTDPFDPIESS